MAREKLRYIRDGYTEDGFIRRQKGIFDQDLRFLFRPMTKLEQQKLVQEVSQVRKDDVARQLKLQAMAVSRKIIEWDYTQPDGKPIPISHEAILEMKPALVDALCAIVCGYEGSDTDDEAAHRKNDSDEAAMNRIFGDEASKEEADAKNFVTG